MEHYNLMPTDCFDTEIVEQCGSLFPFITTKTSAIKYAKSVKRQFPNVHFQLTKGETWGNQELVQEF